MKQHTIVNAFVFAALLAGTTTLTASVSKAQNAPQGERKEMSEKDSQANARLAREAKITMEQARETALKRAPGTVESGELEREHKQLVYSFDIRNAKGTITEVQVSAITGKVVRVEYENKKKEAAEKRKEQHEKRNSHR
ncbi:MAG: hypothetical protein NVSMB56_10810 [Pyrinomonadaceae bacterium]